MSTAVLAKKIFGPKPILNLIANFLVSLFFKSKANR